MIKYTYVELEGPYDLAARAGTVFCSLRPATSQPSDRSYARTAANGALAVFAGVLRLISVVMRLVVSALLLFGSEFLWPMLREVTCVGGSGALAMAGWLFELLGAGLSAGSSGLASRSRVLDAWAQLRAPRPSVHAGLTAARIARTTTLITRG